MKFYILLQLFFVQILLAEENSFPSKIEISIPNFQKAEKISCKRDQKVSTYICPNGKKPLLVKITDYDVVVFGKDNQNQAKIYKVNKVTAGNKILFESMDNTEVEPGLLSKPKQEFDPEAISPSPEDYPDFRSYYASRVSAFENFFELDRNDSSRVKGSRAYEEIFLKVFKDYDLEKIRFGEKYSKSINDSEYQVLLEDGKKRTCKRDETEKKTFKKNRCGVFNCGILTIGRKEYNVAMLYDSDPRLYDMGSIHLFDSNGEPGPALHIKKINSKNIPIPLVQNSIDTIINAKLNANYFPQSFADDKNRLAVYKDPFFENSLKSFRNSCLPDNSTLSKITEIKTNLLSKLADKELVEFIQMLSDGRFISNFIDPNSSLENACYYRGILLDRFAYENIDLVKKNIRPDENIEKTITSEKASQLFNKALAMKDIAWKYKKDGCYARAHLMARRFEAEGVRVDKVWVNGNLKVNDSKSSIEWIYHVAPIVYVKNTDGLIQKLVIDPSLFDKPVTVDEWDQKMTKSSKYQKSVPTVFPFPSNSGLMERSAIAFSSSDPYMPGEDTLLSEDKKIEMAKKIMKTYIGLGKK